ncbi:MAG TPA: hypothetical protein VM120_08855 [Bryobacteraceae bacterium]|nr:hypothetical protein [Bryobacteraceae bacterium]
MASTATTTPSGEREKLRVERGLRLISEAEQGNAVEYCPNGIYGFTYAPNTEAGPLWIKPTFQIFEVHKLADGNIHLVGFMTTADAQALEQGKDAGELKLYPEPFEQATRLCSVPRARILKAKQVSREHGNWMSFTPGAR